MGNRLRVMDDRPNRRRRVLGELVVSPGGSWVFAEAETGSVDERGRRIARRGSNAATTTERANFDAVGPGEHRGDDALAALNRFQPEFLVTIPRIGSFPAHTIAHIVTGIIDHAEALSELGAHLDENGVPTIGVRGLLELLGRSH